MKINIEILLYLENIHKKMLNKQDFCLKQYLEIESLLNKLFDLIKYCEIHCTNQKISKFSKYAKGQYGCCLGEFYRFTGKLIDKELSVLNKARIKKYGLPKNNEDPILGFEKACSYHTQNGCILKDHKGIACISYVCVGYKDFLKETYDIDYDYDEIRDFIEDIFLSKVDDHKLRIFKEKIICFIDKVKKVDSKIDSKRDYKYQKNNI